VSLSLARRARGSSLRAALMHTTIMGRR
jgi:hypothetical protein